MTDRSQINAMPHSSDSSANPSCAGVWRWANAGGILCWALVALLLMLGVPKLIVPLCLIVLLLGAWSPKIYILVFALAMPWFGNNPGGGHALYLIDFGLMGLVMNDHWLRLRGRRLARPTMLDPWIVAFILMLTIGLLAQIYKMGVVVATFPRTGWFTMFHSYGNAPFYGFQVVLKSWLAWGMYRALRDGWTNDWQGLGRWWHWAVVSAFAIAIMGFLNWLGWLPLAWWRGENPDLALFDYHRLQATFWHSGWLAQYFACFAPATVVWGWYAQGRRRWLWWGMAACFMLVQLLTFQRAGWLAIAAGYTAAWLAVGWLENNAQQKKLWRRYSVLIGIVGIIIFVGALLSVAGMKERFSEAAHYAHRTEIWRNAFDMVRHDYPWTGVGTGNYHQQFSAFYPPGHERYTIFGITAHNTLIHLTAEGGLLTGLVFAVIWLLATGLLWPRRSRSDANATRCLVFGAWVALSAYGVFQHLFYLRIIELMCWGMLAVSGWNGLSRPLSTCGKRLGLGFAILLAVGMAGVFHAEHTWRPQEKVYWIDGHAFQLAGESVELLWPGQAEYVRFRLANWDALSDEPFVYELWQGGQLLRLVELQEKTSDYIYLKRPEGYGDDAIPPLTIKAKRMLWPYRDWGNLLFERRVVGVAYQPLEVVAPEE